MNVGGEMMDLEGLAAYLRRDVREVGKLVSRGHVPGQKVRGEWRFARAEINHWIETQLPGLSEEQLVHLEEARTTNHDEEPLIAGLLGPDSIAVPFAATTKTSVLKELVLLAEQTWQVYDPDAILDAVRQREELLTTALPGGIAIPHPRRPMPNALGESVIAFARSPSGIPFGAPRGGLTDLFFLVLCRDDRTHLRVLARLTRLVLRDGFLDGLRAIDSPAETWKFIASAEEELMR
jgi:PTS system nitrogen regulatory IIA component